MQKYLEIACIGAAHGIHGECRATLFCDGFETVRTVRHVFVGAPDGPALKVVSLRMHGKMLLLRLEGYDTPEQVAALRGKTLYAAREELQLAAGRVFNCDLVGLPVRDADSGATLGTLLEVLEYPANNVYRIRTGHGEVLFPAVPAFLVKADPQDGILVRPIPGMFDDTHDETEE